MVEEISLAQTRPLPREPAEHVRGARNGDRGSPSNDVTKCTTSHPQRSFPQLEQHPCDVSSECVVNVESGVELLVHTFKIITASD